MSAFEDGVDAGREFRSTGGTLDDYDYVAVREQALLDVGDCSLVPLATRQHMIDDWLFGFQKAMCEEATDEV